MPIWKASSLQKEEGLYGSVLQALPGLAGEGLKALLGDSGILGLLKFSSWADFPSRQHSNPPGHKLHWIYPEGKPPRCFTTVTNPMLQ